MRYPETSAANVYIYKRLISKQKWKFEPTRRLIVVFFKQVCLHLELYSSHVAKRATQLERRYLLAVKTAANVHIYYRVNF